MFDIGGGSTELVWMRCQGFDRELIGWTSLPCGVVTLAETHGGDQIARELYDKMVSDIGAMLVPFDAEHGISQYTAGGETQMLGTSGTVTTIAGVHLNLPRYDRSRVDGLQLSFDAIDAVTEHLVSLDQKGRAAIPTIGPDRADLVVAGCAILDAIRKQWPVGSLWVADRGIREGMLMDMIHPCRPAPVFAS
jgi:exopolyphosphatase/guanosine-5'-triphosphate,3'-diphosphate pyrophosphatase